MDSRCVLGVMYREYMAGANAPGRWARLEVQGFWGSPEGSSFVGVGSGSVLGHKATTLHDGTLGIKPVLHHFAGC